jgi:serine/threonine protein kinase/Flp pilus assembly protein TadD
MTGQMVSHYRIGERLGRGGMGVVFVAEDLRLGRQVAIKFLPEEACCNPEAVERFLREARAISSLNHPHICTLHDIDDRDGQQYMVMELLEGEPLRNRIARGPLPIDDVLLFGEQIADALDAAHAKGIVHRDLKPANLFITSRGQVKVLDFGVAKLTDARGDGADLDTMAGSAQLTTYGSALGTIHYMSPEQARGLDIDARSDLFSLGIVLYEMATGRAPFQGNSAGAVFEQIFGAVPPAPSQIVAGISTDFDRIVFRALEKDRELRHQSAADLRADLKRLRKATESGRILAAPSAAPWASDSSSTPSAAAPGSASVSAGPSASSASSAAPPMSASSAAAQPSVLSAPSAASPVSAPSAADPPSASRRSAWWVAAPLLASAAVIAGVLWWRSAATPALTNRDTVVLSDFVNRTGDTMFDGTLNEALAVQLRQSPFLNLLNEQQQQATLRLMGRDPASPVTTEIGREVCQRNAARAVLGGSIASVGTSYLMTLSARDCVTGDVLAEEQVQAASKEEVLRALGGAASSFRERLGESLPSVQRYDARIEMATTPSLDALKQYSQGVLVRRTQGDLDSVPFFEEAIRKDPGFALAYARLGTVLSNLGRRPEAEAATTKAYELRERVSERERLYIEARYHTIVTEDVGKAIETYRILIATYPDDFAAHTNLGSLLKNRGELADAMSSLREAVRLAPEQPTARLNLAYSHLENGELDEARKGFEHLIKLQDSTSARRGLFLIGIVTGDEAFAAAQVEAVRGRRDEIDLLPAQAVAASYQGRFREGGELLELWQRRTEQAGRRENVAETALVFAISEAFVGLDDRARERLAALKKANALTPGASDEWLALAAILGDAAEAGAAYPVALAEAKESPDQLPMQEVSLRALLALANGDAAEAVRLLEPITLAPRFSRQVLIWSMANHRLGRREAAIQGLEWLKGPPPRHQLDASRAYILKALADNQEALGRAADAARTREQLAELWKNADADVPLTRR